MSILDNLNTHKPKRDRWLARPPKVHFHFTPTYASWLNQVEVWFSILARAALKGASFTLAHSDERRHRCLRSKRQSRRHAIPMARPTVYPNKAQGRVIEICASEY